MEWFIEVSAVVITDPLVMRTFNLERHSNICCIYYDSDIIVLWLMNLAMN
jgi:hypothetical protein